MEVSVKSERYSINKTLNLTAEFKLVDALYFVQQVAYRLL